VVQGSYGLGIAARYYASLSGEIDRFQCIAYVLALSAGLKHGIRAVQLRICFHSMTYLEPMTLVLSVVSLSPSRGPVFDLLPSDREGTIIRPLRVAKAETEPLIVRCRCPRRLRNVHTHRL
jgi:hypothetical protein